jgi:maleylacetate reductase
MSPVAVYDALPGRVLFGAGAVDRLADEVDRLGAGRVLLVAGRSRAAHAAERLGDRVAATWTGIV